MVLVVFEIAYGMKWLAEDMNKHSEEFIIKRRFPFGSRLFCDYRKYYML